MLNSLIKNEYASKDLMRKRIVSKTLHYGTLRIDSLFTNIPLYKTIAKQLLCLTT